MSLDQDSPANPWQPRTLALLGLLLLAAGLLRFYRISSEGFWYDELIMARLTAGPWEGVVRELSHGMRPPLYVVLGWGWTHLFGTSELAIRSLAALLGTGAVGLVFLAARPLFGPPVAWVAALLLAASPYQLHYSQEHRYYALLVFVTALMFWTLQRALLTERRRWFAALALAMVLMVLAHHMAVLALASLFVACVLAVQWLTRKQIVGLALAFGATGLTLAVPLFALKLTAKFSTRAVGEGEWITWVPPAPWWTPLRTMGNFLLLGRHHVNLVVVAAAVAVVVLGALLARWRPEAIGRRAGHTPARQALAASPQARTVLLASALMLVLPPLMLWVISAWLWPTYLDRYVIPSSVSLYLLLAVAVVWVGRIIPPAATTAAIVLCMLGNWQHYLSQVNREQWRELAAHLQESLRPGDMLMVASARGDPFETRNLGLNLMWYLTSDLTPQTVDSRLGPAGVVDLVAHCEPPSGRVWFLVWQGAESSVALRNALANPPGPLHLRSFGQYHGMTLLELTFPESFSVETDDPESMTLQSSRDNGFRP